jgi:hypothetical protein
MTRLRSLPPFAAACVLLAACDPAATISPHPHEIIAAPTSVSVDGHQLTLETHLWRDFQPVAPPNGQPLIAVLRVKTVNGSPFPAGVTADQVTVVYGELAWTAPARQEFTSWQQDVLEVVARDGPRWGPHVKVDVVVRLRGADGQTYYLRAPEQTIGRTD